MFDPALIRGGKSRLVNATWALDKYPDAPEFFAHKKLVLLDEDGPGRITQFHSTVYLSRAESKWTKDVCKLRLTVYYDHDPVPAIDMPLCAFFGDPSGENAEYGTLYLNKTRIAYNSYLPMPFKRHIRIECENESDTDLFGYLNFQIEALPEWDEELGYLHVAHHKGRAVLPDDRLPLLKAQGKGSVVAHWLRFASDYPRSLNGDLLCEGNDEFYIDGEKEPSLEYLGTEDFYGFSWGFGGVCHNPYGAIGRQETKDGKLELCMLRVRTNDAIRFDRSLEARIDYSREFFNRAYDNPKCEHFYHGEKHRFETEYESGMYYYLIP